MASWDVIRKLHAEGKSTRAIAKIMDDDHGEKVSHVAIYKRAKAEGWGKADLSNWDETVEALPSIKERRDIEENPDTIGKKIICANGKRSPEVAKAILGALERGQTFVTAAGMCGVSTSMLTRWRKDDPQFNDALSQARMHSLGGAEYVIEKAAQRGDWKAGLARLRASKSTAAQWQGADNAKAHGTTINVTLSVPRLDVDNAVTIEGEAVTIEASG